jgi:hypothetical protein
MWLQSSVRILDTFYSTCGCSPRSYIGHSLLDMWLQSSFVYWTLFTRNVVAVLGSYIGHSLLDMWLQSSFVYWTLFTRHVVAVLGSYIGHSLLEMWLQSSVRILDTLYSTCGCSPRFVYWTLYSTCGCNPRFVYWTLYSSCGCNPRFVYWTLYSSCGCNPWFVYWTLLVMWLQSSVRIFSGVMWPCHLVSRITTDTTGLVTCGCNPPPSPLPLLLYTQGRFYESPPFAWFSFRVSSPPHTIERIYRYVSAYLYIGLFIFRFLPLQVCKMFVFKYTG